MAKLGRPEFGGGGTRSGMSAGRAKVTIVRPKPKAASAETAKAQKASVKKLPNRTAPKTDLSSRGVKPTQNEKITRARDAQWDKAERTYDAALGATGLRGGPNAIMRGAKGKNVRKQTEIRKAANKDYTPEQSKPVKINSANLKPNKIIKKTK